MTEHWNGFLKLFLAMSDNYFGLLFQVLSGLLLVILSACLFFARKQKSQLQDCKKGEKQRILAAYWFHTNIFFEKLDKKLLEIFQGENEKFMLFLGGFLKDFKDNVSLDEVESAKNLAESFTGKNSYDKQFGLLDQSGFSDVANQICKVQKAIKVFDTKNTVKGIIDQRFWISGLLSNLSTKIERFLACRTLKEEDLYSLDNVEQGFSDMSRELEFATPPKGENKPENNVPVLEVGESFDLESHPGLSGWAEKNFEKSKQDIARWVTDRDGFKK